MYSVTDQQKTNEFDSQMKKNQVKNITPKIVGQMEQHNVHNCTVLQINSIVYIPIIQNEKNQG